MSDEIRNPAAYAPIVPPRGEGNAERLYWSVALFIIALDFLTKRWAEQALMPAHVPHDVLGEWVRFTLTWNPGAAFGMHVGQASRLVFTGFTIAMLIVLWRLHRGTPAGATGRTLGLALVTGGAVGNLLDRLRGTLGVVDFIDVGIGETRFWTFNVADVSVSVGAVLLILAFWREERQAAASAAASVSSADAPAASPPLDTTGSST
jgi:signal peptidase II